MKVLKIEAGVSDSLEMHYENGRSDIPDGRSDVARLLRFAEGQDAQRHRAILHGLRGERFLRIADQDVPVLIKADLEALVGVSARWTIRRDGTATAEDGGAQKTSSRNLSRPHSRKRKSAGKPESHKSTPKARPRARARVTEALRRGSSPKRVGVLRHINGSWAVVSKKDIVFVRVDHKVAAAWRDVETTWQLTGSSRFEYVPSGWERPVGPPGSGSR